MLKEIFETGVMAKAKYSKPTEEENRERLIAEFKDCNSIGTLTIGDDTMKCYVGDVEKHKINMGGEVITKSVIKLIEV